MHRIIIITITAVILVGCDRQQPRGIDLTGEWQFSMDPEDRGEGEGWYNRELEGTIRLPGSMAENGLGHDIDLQTRWTGGVQNTEWYLDPAYAPFHDPDNIRFPYWLQPVKKYTGAAWYRRSFDLPGEWTGKVVFLELERPHWESVIWINGQKAGMENSLSTPHTFDITPYVGEGTNTLTVRIDNRTKSIDVGENSHSISDHTQSNWNGIAGRLKITGRSSVCFTRADVFPDLVSGNVKIKASILNATGDSVQVDIHAAAGRIDSGSGAGKTEYSYTAPPGDSEFSMEYLPGVEILAWDEFNPNLYRMDLTLRSEYGADDRTVDYGYRDFRTAGSGFTINGRPVFLRGTLECAIFPKTGYPPADRESWSQIYEVVKAHGLNHVRFHSWCPPEAAFTAADRAGVYLQVECSSWANQSTQLGSGLPVDEYIWRESERIVDAYGNHPSFVLMAYGNEPGGPGYSAYLTEFLAHWKQTDTRRVYTGAAGWPVIGANEFHNIPEPRIQRWGEELGSIINAFPPSTDFDWQERIPGDGKPVVSHEIGQWCVYPDFGEIEKYTGVLKAKNFELFRESLESNHMGHLAHNFLMASGKLQALCYKADIEAALRTPGLAGFQLLDLHDFPGQGTALVGVLNPFWEEKGYISAEEYRRFCNAVVPLARFGKMIYAEGENLEASIEIAQFGPDEVMTANPSWELTRDGKVVAEGNLGEMEIPRGHGIKLGDVAVPLLEVQTPAMLSFRVKVGEYANSWDLWVYPAEQAFRSETVMVTEKLDREVMDHLEGGGKVLLSIGKGRVSEGMGGEVGVGFSSIFWNTAWTGNQKPHTLGILCDPEHPALDEFPTSYHSNWQWWDAMSHADAIRIDSFPPELEPLVRIIDDWVTNRRLALIFEAKVGDGKLLVSGTDLVNALEERPAARQLLSSLLKYIESEQFQPATELTPLQVLGIAKQ
jgi:hypothetical protein